MFKIVIFDFDGTLVDSNQLIESIFISVKDKYGFNNFSAQDLKNLRNRSLKDIVTQLKISPFRLAKIASEVRKEVNKKIETLSWIDGVLPMLKNLHQNEVQLGILSSSSQENLEKFISFSKIDLFEFIYSGKNLFGKDKDLTKLIKEQHLIKNEVLYVGDEVRDIEACQKVGLVVAGVTWGFEGKTLLAEARPDYLIEKPEELLNIILGK